MTERLYYAQPAILEFTATVLDCQPKDGAFIITLDRTAFYPEGGGQGADHGTLNGIPVTDVHETAGMVLHTAQAPIEPGTSVTGVIDRERRLGMTQQHSGEHIFSGLVHKLYGYDNVGFHIGSEAVTMDFNGPLTLAQALEIERMANEAIWQDKAIRAWVPDPETLAAMEYRSKKALEGDVRIVEIEDCDTCACCGTHVRTVGGIGQIKLLGVQKYKSGVRVSILSGVRALDYENEILTQIKAIGNTLSCKPEETAESVAKLLAQKDESTARCDALGLRLLEAYAGKENGPVKVLLCDMLPAGKMRGAASKIIGDSVAALLLAPKEGGWNFVLHSPSVDIRPMTKALCDAFGGRGGGPKEMTQGTLPSGSFEAIKEKCISLF